MIVADILADAKRIFAQCETPELYRRLTDAINLLSTESDWDANTGYLTVATDTEQCITLPRDVEKVLAVQLDGYPAFARDKWFEFHINGPGQFTRIDSWKGAWDDRGYSALTSSLGDPDMLTLTSTDPGDAGKGIRIFGYDDNDRELFTGEERGIVLSVDGTTTDTIKQIVDISKDLSDGTFELKKQDTTLVGFYYPDEIFPRYKRIRVPTSTTVTMIYRRKGYEIKRSTDYIPLDSRIALLSAMRSMKHRFNGDLQSAQGFEADAIRLASREQQNKQVEDAIGPQINNSGVTYNGTIHGRGHRTGSCCPDIF